MVNGGRLTVAEPYTGPLELEWMKKYANDGINGSP
jgi:hypothetical protein